MPVAPASSAAKALRCPRCTAPCTLAASASANAFFNFAWAESSPGEAATFYFTLPAATNGSIMLVSTHPKRNQSTVVEAVA